MKSRKLMPEIAGKPFWNHYFLGCNSLQREMIEATSLGTFATSLTKAPETAAENSPGLAGLLTGLAKRSFLGLLRGCYRGSELFLSFTTTVWWTTLLFPSCQRRGKTFLWSKIFPPRWRINRRQIPMSHSSASLLIVLGMSLPPSYTAIGPSQDRTSLFCLIKFYWVAFQNNNSYTGTLKARKAHRQEKTCLQLIKATRIVA